MMLNSHKCITSIKWVKAVIIVISVRFIKFFILKN